jgi:hypothetical protein
MAMVGPARNRKEIERVIEEFVEALDKAVARAKEAEVPALSAEERDKRLEKHLQMFHRASFEKHRMLVRAAFSEAEERNVVPFSKR